MRKLNCLHRHICIEICLFFISVLLSGCVTLSDPESFQEYRADVVGTVRPGSSIGQTFIARRGRLNGIQLWFQVPAETSKQGRLFFELYHDLHQTTPVATSSVSIQEIASNPSLTIVFPVQNDPPHQTYALYIKTQDGPVNLLGRNEDALPGGQAYINDTPLQADLSLRLNYDYDTWALLADIRQGFNAAWLLGPLAMVVWLPGFLLLDLTGLRRNFDSGEIMGLSLGLSMALIPVLMTWTTTLGLHWNRGGTFVASGMLILFLAWRARRRLPTDNGWKMPWIELALAGIFVLTFVIRLMMVRDQAAPLWVDSVHHAMIARLIVQNGAFPGSYAPFLEIETANYHSGFHSLVAVFQWLSGLDVAQAMLWFGQALNALMVFPVYLFTTTFTRQRRAGVLAALTTGLLSPMPAYYTSWGRYTQLASLLILPAAVTLILALLENESNSSPTSGSLPGRWPYLGLAALACAGLFLTHYRVLAFLPGLLILAALPIFWRAARQHHFRRQVPLLVGQVLLVALGAIIFSLPWWPDTLKTLLIPKLSWTQGATPFSDFSWGYLTSAAGKYVLTLAGAGLVLALFQRRIFPFILAGWGAWMFFLANLGVFHLPGSGYINNTSVEITLFIPLSALVGYLTGWLATAWENLLPRRWHPLYWSLVAGGCLAAAWFGGRQLLTILNPVTMLFRQADRPALEWIMLHIPEDATVLINPMSWGYNLYAGSDGGYWITPLAGRKTLPPPVLYGLENSGQGWMKISQIAQQVIDKSKRVAELHDYLQSQQIDYIYIGARGGALSARALQESTLFEVLYQADGTWVFAVR